VITDEKNTKWLYRQVFLRSLFICVGLTVVGLVASKLADSYGYGFLDCQGPVLHCLQIHHYGILFYGAPIAFIGMFGIVASTILYILLSRSKSKIDAKRASEKIKHIVAACFIVSAAIGILGYNLQLANERETSHFSCNSVSAIEEDFNAQIESCRKDYYAKHPIGISKWWHPILNIGVLATGVSLVNLVTIYSLRNNNKHMTPE